MRFHIPGLSHTRTSREYSVCAFTGKIRLLCRMLADRGHEVYHYGTAGSDPVCTEHVEVLDEATFAAVHGAYDYKAGAFDLSQDTIAYRTFTAGAIAAIRERAQPGDFLLAPFGTGHKDIADAFSDLIVIESGIGYDHTFARWRVFESYSWLHYHYGKEGRGLTPDWYDVVIPNAYDLDDYPYQADKADYAIFLGRPTALKGRQIAIDTCRELGIPLFVAGQGDRTVPAGVTHLGVLGIEERARWVGGARVLFAPTYYIEPWGNVVLEAALLGTPVICTDFGGFAENVLHGVTGYRCRTFEQFIYAARHSDRIQPADCRRWGENFSLARVGAMYQEYFEMLAALHVPGGAGWYTRNEQRTELDWLAREYPR